MLELYYRKFCPYSRKVRDFIAENGLLSQIETYEIGQDREAMARLKNLIGGQQVPCLVIDGKPLLESEDIIAWLANNVKPSRSSEGFRWATVTSTLPAS